MKSIVIIPARFESSRFPGKPLADIGGKTMIERVYRQCQEVEQLDELVVATDDERIFDAVKNFHGKVVMTDKKHKDGTSRIAEVIKRMDGFDLVINVQGDEPFINPKQIDDLITQMKTSDQPIGTVAKRIDSSEHLFNPNTVKVIIDKKGRAIYFSRQALPFQRGIDQVDWIKNHTYYKHIGLYAYKKNVLLEIVNLPTSKLAQSESLEQLTWLDNGYEIIVSISDFDSIGIDSPEDLQKALELFNLN